VKVSQVVASSVRIVIVVFGQAFEGVRDGRDWFRAEVHSAVLSSHGTLATPWKHCDDAMKCQSCVLAVNSAFCLKFRSHFLFHQHSSVSVDGKLAVRFFLQ
jgi:hypothetical protein